MNKVYLLLHETYEEFDNYHDTSVYIFEKYEDGLFYLDEMKQKIIEDYLRESNEDINFFLNNDDNDYYREIDERKGYFYIYLEEHGWDRLSLEEYDILKF
jgi:hypothetical protein